MKSPIVHGLWNIWQPETAGNVWFKWQYRLLENYQKALKFCKFIPYFCFHRHVSWRVICTCHTFCSVFNSFFSHFDGITISTQVSKLHPGFFWKYLFSFQCSASHTCVSIRQIDLVYLLYTADEYWTLRILQTSNWEFMCLKFSVAIQSNVILLISWFRKQFLSHHNFYLNELIIIFGQIFRMIIPIILSYVYSNIGSFTF